MKSLTRKDAKRIILAFEHHQDMQLYLKGVGTCHCPRVVNGHEATITDDVCEKSVPNDHFCEGMCIFRDHSSKTYHSGKHFEMRV